MPPSCLRCDSQRVINLETARQLGVATGALVGTLQSAYVSLYAHGSGTLVASPHFPLSRVAVAVVAGASGGIAGAAAGHRLVKHLFPPGDGTPWLCLGCGHAFRELA
ncbi:hypothetical protein KG088_18685 [Halomonas sp. TRM85114]|uniref:hypothetical protein n=1 Tax=Halomonas jincaotanensis TaxID=2810616 RepID=UPI001BD59C97|nr:hypothetical protein [Halomonas jincaotanensis]MBS9405619.1 hypothetical protein [Halomonas jincaotanensis]